MESKADWKDVIQSKKYVSYNIWSEIMRNRSNIRTNNLYAQGYLITYPTVIYVNAKYYGTL